MGNNNMCFVLNSLEEGERLDGLTKEDIEQFKGSWKIMRLRPDKPANSRRTAESVWESISNPVEPEEIIDVTEDLKSIFG